MEVLRKLPIGVQNFESLVNDGYLYVDKTEQLYKLISTGRYYFLSRPRRFGKSLLISTIKALFEGKRELFHGLAIDSKADFDWTARPVLHLDLNTEEYDTKEKLVDKISLFLSQQKTLFADTPYELVKDLENHYQNMLWLLYKLLGFYTQAEYHTSCGRIDLAVKTPKYCYIMEFKLDGTAQEALDQISSKDYTPPFTLDGQQTVRIGLNFDSKTRNIEKALVG